MAPSRRSALTGLLAILTCVLVLSCGTATPGKRGLATEEHGTPGTVPVKHGKLQILGGKVCDSDGHPVQLRGMSTHGLQWYGEIINDKAFAALARDWRADVIRISFHVTEGGYASNPAIMQQLLAGIGLAIEHGLYVIVDWHVLIPGDPNHPAYSGAQAFFQQISSRYSAYPNILYEIANEPNGPLGWPDQIKPYAEKTVATIRANDPDNLILIGSGTWSQDVDVAAADPVEGRNLAYTFHFYAGTHGQPLRNKVEAALERGVAVFCSEWGTSKATGGEGFFQRESEAWLSFLDRHGIGWVNFSLADKADSSSALKNLHQALTDGLTKLLDRESLMVPETPGPDGYPIWAEDELTPSGRFVRNRMRASSTLPPRRRARHE